MTRHFLFSLLLLSAMSVLVGCKSSRQAASASGWEQKASPGRPSDRPLPVPDKSLPSGRLIAEAESWLGVPYKYGGNDRKGVDCSGLVLQVYRQALDISMPRNSKAQKDFCTPAKTSELLPGDLVFFATGRDRSRVSHVGIYLGDNRMIHASTNGVVVSDITVPYYTRTFAGAGFVGQYRAMIDDAGRRKHDDNLAMADRKTKKKEKAKGKPRPEPDSRPAPKPEPDPCPEPTEPLHPAPAMEEPAGRAPEPVTTQPAAPVAAPEPRPAAEPAVSPLPVAAATAQPQAEPTTEDARSAVLSNLKEKKLNQQ